MSGGFRVSDSTIETAAKAWLEPKARMDFDMDSFRKTYAHAAIERALAAVLPSLVAEIRSATLLEAADEVHREARWQTETQLRGLPWFAAERLCLMEEILRDRARSDAG